MDDYQKIIDTLESSKQVISKMLRMKKAELKAQNSAGGATGEPTSSPSGVTAKAVVTRARAQDQEVVTPSKIPTYKRKVSFDETSENNGDDDDVPIEIPTKRQRFSSPTTLTPTSQSSHMSSSKVSSVFTTTAQSQSQTTSVTTSTPQTSNEPAEPESASKVVRPSLTDKILPTRIASVSLPTPNIPGPSTPRRARTATQPRSGSTVYRSGSKTPARMSMSVLELEQSAPPRRYRPVFADQQQWYLKDPKLDKQHRWAEEMARSMMAGKALTTA